MQSNLRFGILTLQDHPWNQLVENWRLIESLGYDSVWIGDHFVNPHQITEDWFDGWTILSALAVHTHTIRIGPLVTNIIYRNPAVIAKQALTLDHISHGRLNLGIGATSKGDPSHYMTGVAEWETAERVQRFREVIEIVDSMLRNEVTSYQGSYYSLKDSQAKPFSIQKPRPPLVIAAIGQTTLKVAAKYADTWNTYAGWNLSSQQTEELLVQRNNQLDQYCSEMGRNPNEITRSLLVGLTQDTPFASLDAFHDFIGRMSDAGMSEFIFYYDYPLLPSDKCMDRTMLERIATEAIPKIRAEHSV
jgi:alkanesulfonate monooxygenase SsuD/methylene tetrahydromethanopterin reductase-like flavin-dependent oxidoreductase (luciferase family)